MPFLALLVLFIFAFLFLFVYLIPVRLWIAAIAAGVRIGVFSLV
ncbi:unnamed protein product, partial [marine sediment metagenome]